MTRIEDLPERDQRRLAGWILHPELLNAYLRIQPALAQFGRPIILVHVGRTREEQQALYAKGRTVPGAIVTNADGVATRSKHQMQQDGYVHAIDFAFVDDPRTPKDETFDPLMPWGVVGQMAEHLGLTWGGRWKLHDLGHIEVRA